MYVNGVDQGHLNGIRVPDYDGVRERSAPEISATAQLCVAQPITDVTSNDVICNGGINPYHQPISKTVITVPAGAQVTAEWHHTLNGADPSDSADPVDPSHKGMLCWMPFVSLTHSLSLRTGYVLPVSGHFIEHIRMLKSALVPKSLMLPRPT